MRRLVAVAIAIGVATPAAAQDGRYAYKRGVTLAEHSADMKRCVDAGRAAQRAKVPAGPTVDPTPSAGGAGSGAEARKRFRAGYDACLRDAGYSQRLWPEADRKAMQALPKLEQPAAFAALVGGPKPRHPEIPDRD